MSDDLVQITGLSKHYREGDSSHSVFETLDFSIRRGEVVALLGSSGCGKSTLLNLIAGIDQPDGGRIEVDGRDIAALSDSERTRWRRRQVGFVFQFFNLIPTLTVLENVRLPLQLNSRDDAANQERARALLAQVGLGERLDSFPEQLSGGEQQRLAIVRALVHEPLLLLADEPTGNLDSVTGEQVLTLLLELPRTLGATVLLVTHSQEVAAQTDRILWLDAGGIEERST